MMFTTMTATPSAGVTTTKIPQAFASFRSHVCGKECVTNMIEVSMRSPLSPLTLHPFLTELEDYLG